MAHYLAFCNVVEDRDEARLQCNTHCFAEPECCSGPDTRCFNPWMDSTCPIVLTAATRGAVSHARLTAPRVGAVSHSCLRLTAPLVGAVSQACLTTQCVLTVSRHARLTAPTPEETHCLGPRVGRIAPNRADAPRDSTIRQNARLCDSAIRQFGNS